MPLDEARFRRLDASTSGAFLLWSDADRDIQRTYRAAGLIDGSGNRRIARVVRVPAGTRLFKATQFEEKWERDPLSSWWSTVKPFHENHYGARELLRTAELNKVSFRELVRFVSAVSLDWNTLNWYVEIVLAADLYAFWGQFAPQKGVNSAAVPGTTLTSQPQKGGPADYVDHGDGRFVYLPETLGGFGAWQLYIPKFAKHLIDPRRIVNLPATDHGALRAHFGLPP